MAVHLRREARDADARGVILDRVALRAVLAARALARDSRRSTCSCTARRTAPCTWTPRQSDWHAVRALPTVYRNMVLLAAFSMTPTMCSRPRDVPLADLDVALARGVAGRPRDAAELLAHGLHRDRVGAVVATFDRHEVPAVLLCAVDHPVLFYWVFC